LAQRDEKWNSKWRHDLLEVSTKPRRDVQAIPGLFIAYDELQDDRPLILIGVSRTAPGYCYTRCSLIDGQLEFMEEVIDEPYRDVPPMQSGQQLRDDVNNDDGGHAPVSSSNKPGGKMPSDT
jgi:hypothetical protein